MKATIVDVAKKAGVSVATVSRVVNGNYPVRDSTRERVNKAIEVLQYVPNLQARELNMQRSTTIGVVVPGLYNMFFAEVIDGIEDNLRRSAYSLLLSCAQNDPQQEEECINNLMSRNVSGIIVISPNTENIKTRFYDRTARRLPMVFINSMSHVPNASYVSNDETAGARTALRYLRGLGHEKILFVRGAKSDSYRVKEEAYRELMTEDGLFDERYVVNIGAGNSLHTVDTTMNLLMELLPDCEATAALCCNDLMGVGVLNACKRLGIRVPEQMSIMGYDNTSLSRFVEPKLTTMDQNMLILGSNAAELLIEKIETGRSKKVVLENILVPRETTGPRRG